MDHLPQIADQVISGMAIVASHHLGQGQAVPILQVVVRVLGPGMTIPHAVVKQLHIPVAIPLPVHTSTAAVRAIIGMAVSVRQVVTKVRAGQIAGPDPELIANLPQTVVVRAHIGIMAHAIAGLPALIAVAVALQPVTLVRV